MRAKPVATVWREESAGGSNREVGHQHHWMNGQCQAVEAYSTRSFLGLIKECIDLSETGSSAHKKPSIRKCRAFHF